MTRIHRSAPVQILPHRGDVDAAWDTSTEFGCDDRLWLTLTRAREAGRPSDAIGVYEREVLAEIDHEKNGAYRSSVELLARIQRLADAASPTPPVGPSGSATCSSGSVGAPGQAEPEGAPGQEGVVSS